MAVNNCILRSKMAIVKSIIVNNFFLNIGLTQFLPLLTMFAKNTAVPKKITFNFLILILAFQKDWAWNSPNRGAFLMMRGLFIQNKKNVMVLKACIIHHYCPDGWAWWTTHMHLKPYIILVIKFKILYYNTNKLIQFEFKSKHE